MGLDMASVDMPYGFEPYGPVLHANMYAVGTSNAVGLCPGDLVEAVGTSITTSKYGTLPSVITEETGAAGTIIGACLATFDYKGDPCYYIPKQRAIEKQGLGTGV